MAVTSSTTYGSTIQTKYLKKLLQTAAGRLVAPKFANTKHMGKGEGDTVRFNKILRPAKQTSVASKGVLVTDSSAKALTSNFRDAAVEIWQDVFGFEDQQDVTSFIKDKDNHETIATQMQQSLDYQIMKRMATQGFRHRIDKDATYIRTSAATAASTTTSLVTDATFVVTSDDLNGGYVTVTNPGGANYDQTSLITDCTTTTADTAAVVFAQACDTSSKLHATVGTGIAATDVLTTTALLDVSGRHELFETEKFDGGLYRMFMHAGQHRDLWSDTTFLNSAIYDDSGRFKQYKVGRWFDIEFLVSSEVYREDVDGTENQSTGIVYVSPVFGKNSYSVISFANPGGSGKFGVTFHVTDKPDSGNLTLARKYLAWKGMFAATVTRSTSMIGLMTGATDMGITV